MKRLSLVFLFFGLSPIHAESPRYPELFFRYSFLFDQVCSPNNPVNSQQAREASDRQSEFRAIWEKDAPTLFRRLFLDFGKGFSRRELTATLSVCAGSPPFSDPLVLNVIPYLKSAMGSRPPYADYKFVDMVFHELLHTWLLENFSFNSPLEKKYIHESRVVRVHLHLMAVQKLVYTELGRTDLQKWLPEGYAEIGGAYARAWEIVDKIEGYQAFIAELSGAGSPTMPASQQGGQTISNHH